MVASVLDRQVLHTFGVATQGEGFTRLDRTLNEWIATTGLDQGVLHLTCLHTSASLTINENADPRVLQDLSAWMARIAPQVGVQDLSPKQRGVYVYKHDDEGDDDMPGHIRTALTAQTMSLSVDRGRLLLGTWQAVYLWEHRAMGTTRRIAAHLIGSEPEQFC